MSWDRCRSEPCEEEGASSAAGAAFSLQPGSTRRQWPRRALQASAVFAAAAVVAAFFTLHSQGAAGPARASPRKATREAVGRGTVSLEEEEEEAPEEELETCHTVGEGEQCYSDVLDTQQSVIDRPDWYPTLTADSTLEEFQAYLHEQNVCKQPCGLKGFKDRPGCHTAVVGEACYDEVSSTMERYLPHHPESYPGLDGSSTFEEVQAFLHERFSCPKPCGGQLAGQVSDQWGEDMFAPTPGNGPQTAGSGDLKCHTAGEGEPCYDAVVEAMTYGFAEHPDWPVYQFLMADSSFEEFQEALHSDDPKVCPQSCTTSMLLRIKAAKEDGGEGGGGKKGGGKGKRR